MTDKQLIKYVTGFKKGILGKRQSHMMCFAVCAPLVPLLNMGGIDAKLVEGSFKDCNHFWIALPDGRVLDPTADQFNNRCSTSFPPVYLGEPTEIHNKKRGFRRQR